MSNPVQQLLNAEKRAAVIVNDARARKYVAKISAVPRKLVQLQLWASKYAFSLIAWLL